MEFIVCVNANQNNGDYGFRVALVSKAGLANAEQAGAKQNQSGGLRRPGLLGGGSLRARRLQRQQEEQAARAAAEGTK